MVFEILFLIYRYLSVVYRVEGADVTLGYLELDSRARSSSDVHTGDNGPSRITGTKVTKYVSFFKSQRSDVILNHSPLYQFIAIGVI